MRRFAICFSIAFVVSLVLPGIGVEAPNSVLGFVVYLAGVLLLALSLYAAVLIVERIRARRAGR